MKKIRVVCFGGGTGLPTLLAGLKKNPWLEISAVVTMFDTGGSSGELKDRFGILPPGDILKCLLALSGNEKVTREILLRRIINHDAPGHSGGNILLMGLEKVFGNLTTAVDALGQILSVSGKVFPVTLEHSILHAEFEGRERLKGETSIDIGIFEGKVPVRLFLKPPVPANPEVLKVIGAADVLCVGPGSFYTSLIPNFLPLDIKEAISGSQMPIIFISNLMTEGYGMRKCSVEVIVKILEDYLGRPVSKVVVNASIPQGARMEDYAQQRKYPITFQKVLESEKYIKAELWTDPALARHDQDRLAYLVSNLIYQLTGEGKPP